MLPLVYRQIKRDSKVVNRHTEYITEFRLTLRTESDCLMEICVIGCEG